MPDDALLFILLSAVLHAGWNLILKTSLRKLAFNVFMHGSAIAIFSAWWIARLGASLFLGERLSALGLAGILVVTLGAYILQVQEISWVGLSFPLRNLRLPGVLLALSAGVFYSVGAIVDKRGGTGGGGFLYTLYLDVVLFLFLVSNVVLTSSRIHFVGEVGRHWAR